MKPYFHTPERIDHLRAVAQSWIGTPFHPNGRVKGSGVSCQMLPPLIYLDVGFMSSLAACSIPEGPMNWGHAQRESLIEPYIDNQLRDYFASVELSDPLPGDLLGFKVGGCIHHIGICIGKNFVHALPTYGVCECRVDDATWLTRIRRIWRPRDPKAESEAELKTALRAYTDFHNGL